MSQFTIEPSILPGPRNVPRYWSRNARAVASFSVTIAAASPDVASLAIVAASFASMTARHVTDAFLNQTYMGYDLSGNQVLMLDEQGFPTYYTFDAINRRTQVLDVFGNSATTVYDGVSNVTTVGLPPSGLAASTMPFDSIPISFAGFRLNTTTTVLPTSDSGSYASAMPATSVRCSDPTSTWSFSNRLDFGTRSAARTTATRSSTFMKSSIEIRASTGRTGGAVAGGG